MRHCPSTASKYWSNLARSWPPSASPNSLDPGLQVYLQTHSITASKCITTLARLRPPSPQDHGLQVHLQTRSITASKCISPNSLHHGLQVRTSRASKCISKLARSRSRSASLSSIDQGLQVYLQIRSITAPSASLNSLDHDLGVYR